MNEPPDRSRGDAGVPADRAFFEEMFDRLERFAVEREERLFHRLDWLIVRWMLISLAIGAILGLLYAIFVLSNSH